jgi:nitrous oxidase accessory protein
MVFWYSSGIRVANNHVADSRYGLHFMYSHDTRVEDNVLADNSVGVYLMYSNGIAVENNDLSRNRGPSGYGLGLKDCDDIAVRRNRFRANRVGAYIDNSPLSYGAVGELEDNLIAFNEIGLLITPNTKSNIVAGNGFIENEEQVSVHGRGTLEGNEFSRDGRGNFWSDYTGFDLDGDRVGDLPYRAVSLFEDLLAREPNLRVLLHSPAQRAIELTARAIPQVQPEPKFTDPFPLMQPPSIEARETSRGGGGWLAPICLAAAGAIGLTAGMRAWSLERKVR